MAALLQLFQKIIETRQHLLQDCSFTKAVWQLCTNNIQMLMIIHSSIIATGIRFLPQEIMRVNSYVEILFFGTTVKEIPQQVIADVVIGALFRLAPGNFDSMGLSLWSTAPNSFDNPQGASTNHIAIRSVY